MGLFLFMVPGIGLPVSENKIDSLKNFVNLQIFSYDDSQPLSFPIVKIENKEYSRVFTGNDSGLVTCTLKHGRYDFTINRYGYQSKKFSFTISTNPCIINIFITPEPIAQPSVSIHGKRDTKTYHVQLPKFLENKNTGLLYDKSRSLVLLPGVDYAYLFALSRLSVLGYPTSQVRYRYMGVPFANPTQCLSIFGRPYFDFEEYRLDFNPDIENLNQNFGPAIDISLLKPENLEKKALVNVDPLQSVIRYGTPSLPGVFKPFGLTLGAAFTWYDKVFQQYQGSNQRFPHYHNVSGSVLYHPNINSEVNLIYNYTKDGIHINLKDANVASQEEKQFLLLKYQYFFTNGSIIQLSLNQSKDSVHFTGNEGVDYNYTDSALASSSLNARLNTRYAIITFMIKNFKCGASYLKERGWQKTNAVSSKRQNAVVENYHFFYQYKKKFYNKFLLETGISQDYLGEALRFSPRISFEKSGTHQFGMFYAQPHIYRIDGPFATGDISPFRDQYYDWRVETGDRFSFSYKYIPPGNDDLNMFLYLYHDNIKKMHYYGRMYPATLQGVLCSLVFKKNGITQGIHINSNYSVMNKMKTTYDVPFAIKHQFILPVTFISPELQLAVMQAIRAGKLYNSNITNNNNDTATDLTRLPVNYELSVQLSSGFKKGNLYYRWGFGVENPHVINGLFPEAGVIARSPNKNFTSDTDITYPFLAFGFFNVAW